MKYLLYLGLYMAVFFSGMLSAETQQPAVKIQWLGGPAAKISFNGMSILTDPTFGEGEKAFLMGDPNEKFNLLKGPNIKHHKRLTPFPGVDVTDLDLVLISHAHEDHFDQTAQSKLLKNQNFITPVADVSKVKALGFSQVKGLAWGASQIISEGDSQVKITAINAYHSTNKLMQPILGEGNGYWLEFTQGDWRLTLYWTGDSFATEQVYQSLKPLGQLDILIPHLGRVGTSGPLGQISMGADEVVALAKMLKPKKVLPIHHSTYELYLEPIEELVSKSRGQEFGLDLISEGSTLIYH